MLRVWAGFKLGLRNSCILEAGNEILVLAQARMLRKKPPLQKVIHEVRKVTDVQFVRELKATHV